MRVAQAIIENARQVILVADRMKLERSAPIRIGHISQIDTIVCDEALPKKLMDICLASGVSVVIAAP